MGDPNNGRLIISAAIIIPTLLFAKLNNIYVVILLISTIWLGVIGFIDDYIKIYKKNKDGLNSRFKILGQVGIGIIVALFMVFHQDIVVKEHIDLKTEYKISAFDKVEKETTIPFMKDNEFNYQLLTKWLGDKLQIIGGLSLFLLLYL